MDVIWLLARGILIVTFGLAALAKLANQPLARRAAVDLGVPPRAAPAIAVLLPVIEAALAIGLLSALVVPAAWATFVMLAVFSALVGYKLSAGQRPECGCFGAAGARPISWRSLVRNGVLAGLAVAVTQTAHAGLIATDPELTASERLFAAIAGAALLVVAGIEQYRRARATHAPRAKPLEAGDRAPMLDLRDLDGSAVSLDDLLNRGRPVLIVFASTTCAACRTLLPQLAPWQVARHAQITIPIVVRGKPEAVRQEIERSAVVDAFLDVDGAAAANWRIATFPSAALVTGEGVLVSPIGAGGAGVYELLLDGLGLGEIVRPLLDGSTNVHDHENGIHRVAAAELRDPCDLDLNDAPAPLPSAVVLEHEGESFLLDRATGAVVLLNPSAAAVWQCLDGTATLGEIAADVSDVFAIDLERASADVVATARQLGRVGLLANVGSPAIRTDDDLADAHG